MVRLPEILMNPVAMNVTTRLELPEMLMLPVAW
jgi:hypothetical protein